MSARSYFLSTLTLLSAIVTSCALKDASYNNQTTALPGKTWHPNRSPWYCPKIQAPNATEAAALLAQHDEVDVVCLLDIALTNHPLTKLAWANARAQAFQVGVIDSAWYPTVTGQVSLERIDSTVSGGILAVTDAAADTADADAGDQATVGGGIAARRGMQVTELITNLSASYLVLDAGGRYANSQAAREALFSLNWTQNRTIQQVIFNVMQAYYNYVAAKETLIARKEDLENATLSLEAAEAQHAAGIAPILDVLQAKSSQENAVLGLVNAKSQVKITLGMLANALGIPPSMEFETKNLPEKFPVKEICENIEGLLELARLHRPDLAAAQATIIQSKYLVDAAESASLPTLVANGNLERVNFFKDSLFDGHIYTGILTINVPLFNGFFYVNQIREAKENVRAAKANYEALENQALADVISAYYNFVSAKEGLSSAEKYLEYSQESYNAALESYKAGAGTLLNVVATQATLANARSQRIQTRTQWAVSIFNIAFATGTLNPSFINSELPCEP